MSENYFYSSLSAQEIEDTLVGAVVYNKQLSLTTSQKAQARANIGAGEVSTGLIIKGYYDTAADLESAHPMASEGDAYMVGTEAPYDVYIWDAVNNEWVNNGVLTPGDSTIDDNDISLTHTWSSSKINNEIASIDLTSLISDSTTAANKTWSSNKISSELSGKATPSDVATAVAALVDDTTTSASKTWSSQKIAAEIDKCKWKLLWTNPSPASAFAAQTVQIDLSAYAVISIEYANATSLDIYYQSFVTVGKSERLTHIAGSNSFSISHRQADTTIGGVQFLKGQTGTNTENNSVCVPTAIYGIPS